MSTSLSYNGVSFGFLKTHSIDHVPQFDPSGTDQIHTRVILTVESLLYLSNDLNTFMRDAAGQQGGQQQPANLASRIALLQTQLEQPRQPLLFLFNGVAIAPSIDGLDEANGPLVKFCTITGVTQQAVRIEWQVEVALNLCGDNGALRGIAPGAATSQSPIASLRWTTTQNIDENGYTTFETAGLLIGRSNILAALGQSIDSLRPYITPPLIDGFVRNGRYTIQSDGLRIQFALKDVQKLQQPSLPLIQCAGTFTRSCQSGILQTSEVSLKARYQFGADRLTAIGAALNIALSRLMAGDLATTANGAPVAQSGSIREHLYEPIVEIFLSARSNPPTGTMAAITPAWWVRKGASANSQSSGGLETATATAVSSASVNLAASTQLGLGFDPSNSSAGPIDLTGASGAGMLQGFQVMAQQLGDECSAVAAQSAFSQVTLSFPGVPGGGSDTNSLGSATTSLQSASADPTVATMSILQTSVGTLQNVAIANQVATTELGSPYTGNSTPGVWTDYLVEYEYRDYDKSDPTKCNGSVVLSATVPGVPAVRGQIRNPVYYLDCAYTVERIAGAPQVPIAQDYPNWLLLNRRCNKPNLDLSADGVTLVYKASGQIEWLWVGTDSYGNSISPTFDYPIPPWLGINYSTLPDLIPTVDPNMENAA